MKIDILKKQIFATIFQARFSNKIKYFISETIHAKENGSRGTHFAKFLISNFLKSLTYSALVAIESSFHFESNETQPRMKRTANKVKDPINSSTGNHFLSFIEESEQEQMQLSPLSA